jgi:hypothetical protein
MDFNIVTLEIADHITHFNYFENLISKISGQSAEPFEDHTKISNKHKEHLNESFAEIDFYNAEGQLLPVLEVSSLIKHQFARIKAKDVHALVETLEKDVKKIKRLYKAINKQ